MGQKSLNLGINNPDSSLFVLGRIGRPFGVKGWVHVQSFTDDPDDLFNYDVWVLSSSGQQKTASCLEYKPHAQHYVSKLDGIDDRDAAALLTNAQIAIPRDQLPPLPPGSYYWQDLEGLSVLNRVTKQRLGFVQGFMQTKASYPTMMIQDPDTGAQTLIPYVESAYNIQVDMVAKEIQLDWAWED